MIPIEYLEQEVPEYKGNVFIEALPQILGKDQFSQKFSYSLPFDATLRSASNEVRGHLILSALSLKVALPRHWDLERGISRMLRKGYVPRRPDTPEYWRKFRAKLAALKEDLKKWKFPEFKREIFSETWNTGNLDSPYDGSLLGIPGTGKTISTLRDLSQYPQVREHGERGFNIRQVVWLYIEMTSLASTGDFCKSVFRAFDEVLETSYELRFGRGSVDDMLGHVINLSFVHALGLLVVDEVQNLTVLKSRGAEAILGFLLRLTNIIQVPVLVLGTYKAQKLLQEFRLLRRFDRAQLPKWHPLDSGREWDIHVQKLWPCQFTLTPTVLGPELSARLFDECQGIPDYAARVYFLAQDWLISRNDNRKGPEIITPGLLSSVAREYLGPAREVLQAIKRRDWELLEKLEDVKLQSLSEILLKKREPVEIILNDTTEEDKHPQSKTRAKKTQTSSTQKAAPTIPCKLVEIVGKDNSDAEKAYAALSKAGYIKSGIEFWASPK
jgi:hypothetical protein